GAARSPVTGVAAGCVARSGLLAGTIGGALRGPALGRTALAALHAGRVHRVRRQLPGIPGAGNLAGRAAAAGTRVAGDAALAAALGDVDLTGDRRFLRGLADGLALRLRRQGRVLHRPVGHLGGFGDGAGDLGVGRHVEPVLVAVAFGFLAGLGGDGGRL